MSTFSQKPQCRSLQFLNVSHEKILTYSFSYCRQFSIFFADDDSWMPGCWSYLPCRKSRQHGMTCQTATTTSGNGGSTGASKKLKVRNNNFWISDVQLGLAMYSRVCEKWLWHRFVVATGFSNRLSKESLTIWSDSGNRCEKWWRWMVVCKFWSLCPNDPKSKFLQLIHTSSNNQLARPCCRRSHRPEPKWLL